MSRYPQPPLRYAVPRDLLTGAPIDPSAQLMSVSWHNYGPARSAWLHHRDHAAARAFKTLQRALVTRAGEAKDETP